MNRDNALSEGEFCVAMKLVMMRRNGHEIPSSLPTTLLPYLVSSECHYIALASTSLYH